MTDPYPLYPEVEPGAAHAPYCGGGAVGCTVCSTAAIIERFKGTKITDLTALGRSMGVRHRAADPRVTHGICPDAWCHYCMYLELKARGIPVGYGNLTWDQIQAASAVCVRFVRPGAARHALTVVPTRSVIRSVRFA